MGGDRRRALSSCSGARKPPPSVGAFVTRLFTTREGWELIVAGNVVGAILAVAVLALSVVSLPMLVDRDVDAGTAMRTSIAAFQANAGMMVRWGLIVAALLVSGLYPGLRRTRGGAAVARLCDVAPLHPAGGPAADLAAYRLG